MKKMKLFIVMAMVLTLVSGCAESSALIRASGASIRTDIFEELSDGGTVPQGYADLRMVCSLKTHQPGLYSAKNMDIHGTPEYRLLVNVDGQAVQLQGALREENGSHGPRDPEAGDGIRYLFLKKLRLKAGTHKVVVGIPADGIAEEYEVTLADGSSNSLVLEPVYRGGQEKRRPGLYGVTSFKEGVRGLRGILNNKPL